MIVNDSTMTCRGICERYRAEKKRYMDTAKRCTSCNIFLLYTGTQCPCCGTQLRAKRKAKYRNQHLIRTVNE